MTRVTRALQARLASAGIVIKRAQALSGTGQTGVSRLDLLDGRQVKVRTFSRIKSADQVWQLLKTEGGIVLPRPLVQVGSAIVTEYVDGVPLDRYLREAEPHVEARLVRQAGSLLATLHRTPKRGTRVPPVDYQQFLTRVTRRLLRKGLLDAQSAASLTRIAERHHHRAAPCAVTHGDVHPKNVILEPSGRIRIIDEERLGVRPVAFELARIVTRWPLSPELEATLLGAYEAAGGRADSFRRDRAFWIATAVAISAAYRLRLGLPGLGNALAQLRRLAKREPKGDPRLSFPASGNGRSALPHPTDTATRD